LGEGRRYSPEDALRDLSSSVHSDYIHLAAPPRVVHDSRRADSCCIYFDIWDSQSGSRSCYLSDRSIPMAGVARVISPAHINMGVPFCTRCMLWGHPESACLSPRPFCPLCRGPHSKDHHRSMAQCCKGSSKANPPIPPTGDDLPCPHPSTCLNCGKPHPTDSVRCPFWHHRYDRAWLARHSVHSRNISRDFAPLLTGETGTRRKKSTMTHHTVRDMPK